MRAEASAKIAMRRHHSGTVDETTKLTGPSLEKGQQVTLCNRLCLYEGGACKPAGVGEKVAL